MPLNRPGVREPGRMVTIKQVLGRLLDHAFDLIPVLLLLAVAAGHARELIVTVWGGAASGAYD
jgi:hypothetical protein